MTRNGHTRRRFGLSIVTLSSIALAGCTADDDSEGHDDHDDNGHGDHDNHDDNDQDDHGHGDHDSDGLVSEFEVIDRAEDEVVASYHGHWHGELPPIQYGEHISLGARIEDADGDEIPIGDDAEYQFDAEISGSDNSVISIESHGDHVHFHSESEGETNITFQLVSNDSPGWETSEGISVEVHND